MSEVKYSGLEIAVIGMSCRVPGANNWRSFWENLVNGFDAVYKPEASASRVVDVVEKLDNFVTASYPLSNKDSFDHLFFGYKQDEAALLNPEHRIFHECVWEALEDAGCDPEKIGSVGLYAGAGQDLAWQVYSLLKNERQVNDFALRYFNNKDYLSSLLSYKLNLKGPSLSINTACSTSLVAIHLACRSLLFGETQVALAGGVSLSIEKTKGYHYQEGMISSSDGHCRAFDKSASGTNGGEGAGVVVLKRLKDAQRDRDHIYCIIKGSAINNDGNNKVGYTAPGVNGQADCIRMAHAFSKVTPDSISYIEAHGTGTRLGDPIEIEALNLAFNKSKVKSCAIGSVKTNIGHLDTAAGVVGLIKTALALKYRKIPASLHFNEPNPEIDFDGGPFYVNNSLMEWTQMPGAVRRAGVSSFGIGGTNAHVVLEENPRANDVEKESPNFKLLVISSKIESSLNHYSDDLILHLMNEPVIDPSDLSYSLQIGRRHFLHRKALVYKNNDELIRKMNAGDWIHKTAHRSDGLVFMCSGAGSQYENMGKNLYQTQPLFRDEINKGFSLLQRFTGIDYKNVLYPEGVTKDIDINDMIYAQPLIFIFGHALATLVMHWGLQPACLIGHSIGEYVAASIGGIFSYEDGLRIAIARGRLMQGLPAGAMISVQATYEESKNWINNDVSLAAINSPNQLVLSGNVDSINSLTEKLEKENIFSVKLHASVAGHSSLMDEILDDFKMEFADIQLHAPAITIISNLTGKKISAEEATSPEYWVSHMRQTVNFSEGINTIIEYIPSATFVEIGGGNSLSGCLKQNIEVEKKHLIINLIRHPKEKQLDDFFLLEKIGQLWIHGAKIDWEKFNGNYQHHRIPLPTYRFANHRYKAEITSKDLSIQQGFENSNNQENLYRLQWKQAFWPVLKNTQSCILFFCDNPEIEERIRKKMNELGLQFFFINSEKVSAVDNKKISVDPENESDYERLFEYLKLTVKCTPTHIVHLWNFSQEEKRTVASDSFRFHVMGYEAIIRMMRSFCSVYNTPVKFNYVSDQLFNVLGNEHVNAYKCTAVGALKVIPREFDGVLSRSIDITNFNEDTCSCLIKELFTDSVISEVAIRGRTKYVKSYVKLISEQSPEVQPIRKGGTYLITGANGGIGKTIAEFLLINYQANLILIGREDKHSLDLSKLGNPKAKVNYICANLEDENTLRYALKEVQMKIGILNGVFHTAGRGDFGGVLVRRQILTDVDVFGSKMFGTQHLLTLLENVTLDFFVNFSSLSATLAPFGQTSYVASNAFLDALAESIDFKFPIQSIQWCSINGAGMALKAISHLSAEEQAKHLESSISLHHMIDTLLRIIGLKIPLVIVSPLDLNRSIEISNSPSSLATDIGNHDVQDSFGNRPELDNSYVEPFGPYEEMLAKLWQQIFHINLIGRSDNFFELGGDSLRAMTLLIRINKQFNQKISLKSFLLNPTIEKLSSLINIKRT